MDRTSDNRPAVGAGSLASLAVLSDAESRSISAENPTGERGSGARAVPLPSSPASELGRGWKVSPCIVLPASSTVTLADIRGPGAITHIWMTVDQIAYRSCLLRFTWDAEEGPSVEVPLGDFFAAGHGVRYTVNSLPVAVNPSGGMNCYWRMPFRSRCRITVENLRKEEIRNFFYQISYELCDVPEQMASFHAQFRRAVVNPRQPEHIILDGVEGRGNYVGTFVSWIQHTEGWWGEGEVKFFIDDDGEDPTICGTGTEDYFGGAWCFGDTYSTPFLGYPLWLREEGKPPRHCMYRWHIPDPIRFRRRLRVTLQALGWTDQGKFRPLSDDIASVAFWYQSEPHRPFARPALARES